MHPIAIIRNLWLYWVVVWFAWALVQNKAKQRSEGLLQRLSYVVPLFFCALILFDGRLPWRWLSAPVIAYSAGLAWTGAAITAAGLLYSLWARAYLGSNWSGNVAVKVGHELVRNGPYRWTRHPIYSGILLAVVGSLLTFLQWRGVFALVLLWLSLRIKMRREEQFMHETFGAQYDEYCRTTAALVPGLPI